MKKYQKQIGFTLIELMIAVVIISILAGIAIPSYKSAVQRSNRADAKAGLTDVAQQLQRCYTAYSKFNDATNCTVYKQLTTGTNKITTTGSAYYDITISNVTATSYTITAKPVSGKAQATDYKCSEISLDQIGKKTAKDNNGNSATNCW